MGAASVGGVILSVIRTSALSVGSITSDTAAEYTKGLKPVYVQICMLLKTGPSPLSTQLLCSLKLTISQRKLLQTNMAGH